MELADVVDSKSTGSDTVPVRVRPPAPTIIPRLYLNTIEGLFFIIHTGGVGLDHVTRIHLKTSCVSREALIDYCLNGSEQCIAIGWSGAFEANPQISTFEEYCIAVKKKYNKRMDHAHNVFLNAQENDLFWTRDLNGIYWLCRVKGKSKPLYIPEMDIGAIIPVEAYKYGLEVPGQIKASFNRPRGGTCHDIYDPTIVEFSKKLYNELSKTLTFSVHESNNDLLNNLPDFDLEELVISYIQLKEGYYLLSNSIANKSTTIKIECEFIHRNRDNLKKAVVQVKGGKHKQIDALDYKEFDDAGYIVYLFAPSVINKDQLHNCILITRDNLLSFYQEYKRILPNSITKWEKL